MTRPVKRCQFGMAIFDESHTWPREPKDDGGYRILIDLDAPYRIQLTGTPMHHIADDWYTQRKKAITTSAKVG